MSGAEAVALVGLVASIAQLADLSKKILSAVEECREEKLVYQRWHERHRSRMRYHSSGLVVDRYLGRQGTTRQ